MNNENHIKNLLLSAGKKWGAAMNKFLNIMFLVFLFILVSCETEFWPKLDKYEETLVVDGLISDAPGPYEVKLSVSSSIQYPDYNPYSGAQVTISDDQGNFEDLIEVEDGSYLTTVNGIQGIVGRKYKIRIQTPKGQIYESPFQTLTKSVGIDTVYHQFETLSTTNPGIFLYGYQFYIDTEEAQSDSAYFLWRATGTYKFKSDFKIRFVYKGYLAPFPNSDSLFTCWKTDQPNQVFTMNTTGLSEPQIVGFPLHFVDTETRKISVRYSLLVTQLTLNAEAYEFYNSLGEMNNPQDLLYNQQPYQVRGNITSLGDNEEPVLGYFLVAGKTEKRIFVDAPSPLYMNYDVCTIGEADYKAFAEISLSDPILWPLFVVTDPNGYRALTSQECVDCTRKGGTLEKPDFWKD